MKHSDDGRRKVRVEREVQLLISQFIVTQMKNDIPGLVTVTRVHMPSDFRAAQVYVSYFDALNETEQSKFDVVKVLQSWARDIQDEISQQLKMRYCPRVTFHLDQSTEHILKIEKILADMGSSGNAQSTPNLKQPQDGDSE